MVEQFFTESKLGSMAVTVDKLDESKATPAFSTDEARMQAMREFEKQQHIIHERQK